MTREGVHDQRRPELKEALLWRDCPPPDVGVEVL
jgi:hypothetical protein